MNEKNGLWIGTALGALAVTVVMARIIIESLKRQRWYYEPYEEKIKNESELTKYFFNNISYKAAYNDVMIEMYKKNKKNEKKGTNRKKVEAKAKRV